MIPLGKIKEIASARGDKNALIYEERKVTWNDFYKDVNKITLNLASKIDCSSELSMCYISPNCIELIYLMSAAATLKIPCTGIDYTQDSSKLEPMLKATGCKILVVSSSYCIENNINIQGLSSQVNIIDIDNNVRNSICYDELTCESDKNIDSLQLQHRPFKSISFTSGTSGIPKPVIRNKSFDGRRFSFFTARYGFSSEDRHLLAMPLYHAAGSGWSRLFMQLGATIIVAKPHDTEHMAQLLKSEWISTSAMTPPLLNEVVRHYTDGGYSAKENNLKFIIVGGKHFHPQAKLQAINSLGPVIYEYYGTTETGVNALAEPSDLITNPTSVGRAYDGNNILVIGKDGQVLPAHEVGRIAIASYMNMDSYGNQDSEFVVIGDTKYLITAETGEMDSSGNIYLRNRAQGESALNIYELENEVRHLPGIKDVAMIPSNKNTVHCGFVTNSDFVVDDFELIRNIKYICKKMKVKLEGVGRVDSIPYSPSGKVRNEELKSLVFNQVKNISGDKINTENKSKISLTKYIVAILCLMGTAMSWGGMFPIAKNALQSMDAVHISLIRYGAASMILVLMLFMKEGSHSLSPGRSVFKLWLFGSFGFAGFSILAFAGLAYTKAQHGAIIMALMPLISAMMMWTLKKVRPAKFTLISIVFALFGVVLVITKGDMSAFSGGNLLPSLVILSGAFCWVTYTLGASYVEGFSVLRYTALSSILGAFTILIIALITNSLSITHAPSMEQIFSVKWELLYLITFAGVIAVFSWNYGINTLGPINGVLFINLVPITAFAIGMARGEAISHSEIFGAAITIAVLLMNNVYTRWSTAKKEKHTPSSFNIQMSKS
ncbi:AMP-binding protein [Photobacterium halotolerans]|uniref:AMP-binding protein n=1 Tax=Photobacterium halotolerans TaxID=265726 RepID=UPI0004176BFD|nr:AMP-binding protein [Photobacterium halotolerans]